MKCAQENAELVKKLSQLEAQNKTLVGQLRRLHQIIVNKGGLQGSSKWQPTPAANPGQAASMQGQGQHAKTAGLSSTGGQGQGDNKGSTALMVLLLSTALFLIPGMKDQLGKLSKILFIRLVAVDIISWNANFIMYAPLTSTGRHPKSYVILYL